jgi:hypothetical protein
MSHHNINNFLHKNYIEDIDIPGDYNYSPSSSDYEIDKEYDNLNYSEKFTNEFTGAEMNNNYNENHFIEKEVAKPVNLYIEVKKENSEDKKFLGRKKAGDKSLRSHTKFSDDNTRRKIKSTLVNNLSEYINTKIEDLYGKDVGEGLVRKRLMKLGQKQVSNASVKFNQEFLYKKLKNIFSENVTTRITNFSPQRNKEVIEELINDQNENRRNYFKGLFNVTFLECLKYYRGDDIYIEYLQGFKKFSQEEFIQNEGEDYTQHFMAYLKKYETILLNKKPRKPKK